MRYLTSMFTIEQTIQHKATLSRAIFSQTIFSFPKIKKGDSSDNYDIFLDLVTVFGAGPFPHFKRPFGAVESFVQFSYMIPEP